MEKTPYEILTGKRPSLSFLKILGCDACVKHSTPTKLEPKFYKYIFVGYSRETKGYYFYNREESKVFVARNAVFLEKEFLLKELSRSTVRLKEVRETQETVPISTDEEVQQDEPAMVTNQHAEPRPRRSIRARCAPEKYTLLTMGLRDILLLDNKEPNTYIEPVMGPESKRWLEAMRSEMESMRDNRGWNLVDPLDGMWAMECKWIFKKKIDTDGNVHIYKARLVAKGFRQIQGAVYDETFSPITMLKSIWILLAIAAYYDYEI
jgi:hypothetical protein